MTEKRNYGIDFLRIISMAMVVMLHILGNGGIKDNTEVLSVNFFIANLFETLSYGAVNCFAMISGYVGISSEFRYSGIITLWRRVFFYTAGITLIYGILKPEILSGDIIFSSLLPVVSNHYWYFTSYFCLFFFTPYINKVINSLEKKELDKLALTLLILFSFVPVIMNDDLFVTKNGYSVIWLAVLYIFGAYIKKRDLASVISKRKHIPYLIYWGCIAITYISIISYGLISRQVSGKIESALLNYTSPTILVSSAMLVLIFSQMKLKRLTGVIKILSPLSFSVYIIHCHDLLWRLMSNRLTGMAALPAPFFVLAVAGCVIAVYAGCSLIDFLRELAERKLKLRHHCDRIVSACSDYFRTRLK